MSIRLYVPQLGDQIRLTQDWTFKLHVESRNEKLFKFLKGSEETRTTIVNSHYINPLTGKPHEYIQTTRHPRMVTLREGCLLKVDRIYIRQGQEGFDSITFYLMEIPESMKDEVNLSGKKAPFEKKAVKTLARFWVKVADANNIYFEPATEPDVEFNLA